MAFKLGDLFYKFTGDTRDLDKAIKDSDKEVSGFGNTLKGIGAALASAFVVDKIFDFSKQLVGSASDVGESVNAVNKVFKDSADEILAWGTQAATQAGLSQSAFNSAATVIGAQLKNSGFELDATAEQTINLTKRAADMASVFNTDVNQALGAIGSLLRGETEPIRQYAVSINEAQVTAEALALGFEKVDGSLSQYAKTQARISLLLKQTNDVTGDFADTNEEYANSIRVAEANLENLRAQLGEKIIPVFTEVINIGNDLIEFIANFDSGAGAAVIALGALALGIGPAITAFNAIKLAILEVNTAALFGPVGIIAGIAAVTAGLVLLNEAIQQNKIKELSEDLKDVSESIGIASGDAASLVVEMDKLFSLLQDDPSIENFEKVLSAAAKDSGLLKSEVLELLIASKDLSDEAEFQLRQYQDSLRFEELRVQAEADILDNALGISHEKEKQQITAKALMELAEEQAAEEQRINDILEARKLRIETLIANREELNEKLREEQGIIEVQLNLGIIDREAYYEKLIQLEEDYQNGLIVLGYDGVSEQNGILQVGNQNLQDSIGRRKQILQDLKNFEIQQILDREVNYSDYYKYIEGLGNDWLKTSKEIDEELLESSRQTAETFLGYYRDAVFGIVESLVTGEDAWQSLTKVTLQSISNIVKALGDQLAAQAALLYAQAFFTAGASIPSAVAATAGAGVAYAAAAAIGAQANNFQDGGFVPGRSFAGDNVRANLNSGEVVLNPEQQRRFMDLANGVGNGQGVNITYQPIFSNASEEEMERFARTAVPYIQRELQRIG